MTSLPDSVPYNIKVSFLEYQRKEWEKVLESFKSHSALENQPESVQHWTNVNNYALEKINEINNQIEELKLVFGSRTATADVQLIKE